MGTPGFAAGVLRALIDYPGCEVVAVYAQPDRPCGRGLACRPPETKVLAEAHGIPVHQPRNFKDPEEIRKLEALAPDILAVAAYGLILPRAVLDVPSIGAWNAHASLLPKYRGAAPIQRAVMNGESSTGITIMQMDEGMDTGDKLLRRAMGIDRDETAGELHDQLAEMGGRLLVEAMERFKEGKLKAAPQNHDQATYAPKLSKADGEIDFDRPALEVHNHIRGVTPWPGAYFYWAMPGRDKPLRIALAPGTIGDELPTDAEPGQILGLAGDMLAIACRDRVYLTPEVIPEGKKRMSANGFYCGFLSRCETG
jgi:methionyl-tRNA formyltransferase